MNIINRDSIVFSTVSRVHDSILSELRSKEHGMYGVYISVLIAGLTGFLSI